MKHKHNFNLIDFGGVINILRPNGIERKVIPGKGLRCLCGKIAKNRKLSTIPKEK